MENYNNSKTRESFPLSYKKIIKKTIQIVWRSILGWGLLWLFCGAPFILAIFQKTNKEHYYGPAFKVIGLSFLFLVLFFLFISILIYLYQKWYFKVYFYDFNDNGLVIKKGPITPKEVTIPYENIQDVGIDQDIFDRMFGLYDVHISSANFMSGLEAHIDGVLKSGAEGLKGVILERAKEAKQKTNKNL